jgi:hypothetical protein
MATIGRSQYFARWARSSAVSRAAKHGATPSADQAQPKARAQGSSERRLWCCGDLGRSESVQVFRAGHATDPQLVPTDRREFTFVGNGHISAQRGAQLVAKDGDFTRPEQVNPAYGEMLEGAPVDGIPNRSTRCKESPVPLTALRLFADLTQ